MPETPLEDLDPKGLSFAQSSDADSIEAIRKRLDKDKSPTTASSSPKWVNWDNLGRTLGQPFDTVNIPLSKLEQMRRDPMIAFGLMFVKVFLARAPWYIKSADAQRAAFIDGALRRIYGRFILAYSGCFDFGFQGIVKRFERVPGTDLGWEYIPSGSTDGKPVPVWDNGVQALVWKPFTALNPRRCAPWFNKQGEFNGIKVSATNATGNLEAQFFKGAGKEPVDPDIPLDWALWATNEKDSVFGSLYGYPRTGYAFRYWWAYWYRFGLADRSFERWADPPIMAYHPVGTAADGAGGVVDFTADALRLAERLRSGANVSMPSTAVTGLDERVTNLREWELKQLETTTDFDALRESFEYLDVAKLRAVMVPEQAFLEGQGGTSSRNVASTLGDVFEEQQALIKMEIDDHINRFMIPQLLEANFGPGGPTCEIVTTGFDSEDMETLRAIVQAFAQNDPKRLSAIDFPALLERLGVPKLSWDAMKVQEDKIAVEAEAAKPPDVKPGSSLAEVVDGRYADARERIELLEERLFSLEEERLPELRVKLDEAVEAGDSEEATKLREQIEEHEQALEELRASHASLAEENKGLRAWIEDKFKGFMETVTFGLFNREREPAEANLNIRVVDEPNDEGA